MIMVRGGMIRCWEGGMEWIPLCEDYYSENHFMDIYGNNPVNYVDPNGLMKVLYNPDGTYKKLHIIIGFIIRLWGGRNIY